MGRIFTRRQEGLYREGDDGAEGSQWSVTVTIVEKGRVSGACWTSVLIDGQQVFLNWRAQRNHQVESAVVM